MAGQATTVDEYLHRFEERRRIPARDIIRRRLPGGYRESINWGMIAYEVPLERYPDTYNRQPLSYVALAREEPLRPVSELHGHGGRPRGQVSQGYLATGKTIDMGKSCVRFKRLEDLPLDVIGDEVASTSPEALIAQYERSRAAAR